MVSSEWVGSGVCKGKPEEAVSGLFRDIELSHPGRGVIIAYLEELVLKTQTRVIPSWLSSRPSRAGDQHLVDDPKKLEI